MSRSEPQNTVARLLRRSEAHAALSSALEGFPASSAGQHVEGHPHTAWQQVEHMRLAAEDLVAYCNDPDYKELSWPEGYWPASTEPPSDEAWSSAVYKLLEATEEMARMVEDPAHALYAKVPTAEIAIIPQNGNGLKSICRNSRSRTVVSYTSGKRRTVVKLKANASTHTPISVYIIRTLAARRIGKSSSIPASATGVHSTKNDHVSAEIVNPFAKP